MPAASAMYSSSSGSPPNVSHSLVYNIVWRSQTIHCTVPDVHQCMYVARNLMTNGSGYEAKFGDEVRLVLFNA